jgi:hypothetical protein
MTCSSRKRSPDVLATMAPAPATKALEYASQRPCWTKECLFSEMDDGSVPTSAFCFDQMWRNITPIHEQYLFPAITWDLDDEENDFIETHGAQHIQTLSSEISTLGNHIMKHASRRPSSHLRAGMVRSKSFTFELDSMCRHEPKRQKREEGTPAYTATFLSGNTAVCNHDLQLSVVSRSLARSLHLD